MTEVPCIIIQLGRYFLTHSSASFPPNYTSALTKHTLHWDQFPRSAMPNAFKALAIYTGAGLQPNPPKTKVRHRVLGKNFLGYCYICIGLELCLGSIVGLPGSRACLLLSALLGQVCKGRTTVIVLPARMVKHLNGESQKLTVTIGVNWSAIR